MDKDDLLRQVREIAGETSGLGDAWVAIHELFLSAVAGGFTEKQALYIIAMGMFGRPNDGD